MVLDKRLCGLTLQLAASRINVALSNTAIQSTTFHGAVAERAIDGNSSPQWDQGSCSHTHSLAKQWWRLELPGVYRVSEIHVTNRNEFREWLNGIEIFIGNSRANNGNDNPRCAIINDDPGCLTQTVKCWGMEGRFINFYKSSSGYLQLCEVKVYGGRNPVYHYISSKGDGCTRTTVGKTSLVNGQMLVLCSSTGRAWH
ncbi:fucolectin-like [Gadus morhua]|uniref:fucolectin-like n=1 Tax=Gadus morhua TaxID=8049 RepID=UPI0011B600EF|nr:fucolectin-like [Gadus morhua]